MTIKTHAPATPTNHKPIDSLTLEELATDLDVAVSLAQGECHAEAMATAVLAQEDLLGGCFETLLAIGLPLAQAQTVLKALAPAICRI